MKESQGGYAAAAAVMDECLFAIRTVVTFGSERRELTRFTRAVEVARKSGVKNRASMGFGFGYFMGTMLASYGLAFWFGGWLMEQAADSNDAKLTPGDILAAFGGVLMGGMSVSQGFPGVIEAMKARTSMTRFFYLLRNGSVIQRRKQDERREMTGHVETFELQNVHFSYPARLECKVLNGVSLKINKGEKVAFVGESGSGKSTVMSLLERFYDPTEGLVLFTIEDIRSSSSAHAAVLWPRRA
jgi:ATP-binding cassette subfamily B (MDR/TAP) protein 1